jgi:hypothetical protein
LFGLLETKTHRDGARKRVYFYSSFFERVRGRAFYFHFFAFTELKEGQRESLKCRKRRRKKKAVGPDLSNVYCISINLLLTVLQGLICRLTIDVFFWVEMSISV